MPVFVGNSRLYSQLVAASPPLSLLSLYVALSLDRQLLCSFPSPYLSLHMVSVINQFVKRNAQRCGKSIPINIKQTLNCLSALTNRATRQHKYHMTRPRKEEACVVVVACRLLLLLLLVVSISRQHIYHLLRTKCFPQTCKRCQRSDMEAQKNSCCLGPLPLSSTLPLSLHSPVVSVCAYKNACICYLRQRSLGH